MNLPALFWNRWSRLRQSHQGRTWSQISNIYHMKSHSIVLTIHSFSLFQNKYICHPLSFVLTIADIQKNNENWHIITTLEIGGAQTIDIQLLFCAQWLSDCALLFIFCLFFPCSGMYRPLVIIINGWLLTDSELRIFLFFITRDMKNCWGYVLPKSPNLSSYFCFWFAML